MSSKKASYHPGLIPIKGQTFDPDCPSYVGFEKQQNVNYEPSSRPYVPLHGKEIPYFMET